MDAVEAEGAVHVPRLLRQEEAELTALLKDDGGIGGIARPLDAVVRGAREAGVGVADAHLQGRDGGGHEVELAERADPLAERGVLEHGVDGEGGGEIGDDEPGRPPRRAPQVEQLVGVEDEHEEPQRQPLGAQPAGPAQDRFEEAPGERPREHEGTGHAEQVAGREQHQDERPPVVHPGEQRGEVAGRELGAEEAVNDHGHGHGEQRELHRRPRVAPVKEALHRPSRGQPAQAADRRGWKAQVHFIWAASPNGGNMW